MKTKTLITAAAAAFMAAAPAMADLVFPSLSYRTGPYAAGGIPFADGYEDYFTLLNERDGGIGGVPVRVNGYRVDAFEQSQCKDHMWLRNIVLCIVPTPFIKGHCNYT